MKSRHVASRLLLCCFASLAILSGSIAGAQSLTGIISGTVTDPTKAPVAGATLTISNADTGVNVWTGKTNPFNGNAWTNMQGFIGLQNLYFNGIPEMDFNNIQTLEDAYREASLELTLDSWLRRPLGQRAKDNLARLTSSLQ